MTEPIQTDIWVFLLINLPNGSTHNRIRTENKKIKSVWLNFAGLFKTITYVFLIETSYLCTVSLFSLLYETEKKKKKWNGYIQCPRSSFMLTSTAPLETPLSCKAPNFWFFSFFISVLRIRNCTDQLRVFFFFCFNKIRFWGFKFDGFSFNLNRELARVLGEKGVIEFADVENVIQKSKSIFEHMLPILLSLFSLRLSHVWSDD